MRVRVQKLLGQSDVAVTPWEVINGLHFLLSRVIQLFCIRKLCQSKSQEESLLSFLVSYSFRLVLDLTFRAVIQFELISMQTLSKRSSFILTHVGKQRWQHHLLKRLFFLCLKDRGSFVKNQLVIGVWVHFWTLSSIPLICVSVLILVLQYVDYCCLAVNQEIGKCESSNFVLFQDYVVCYVSVEFLNQIKVHLVRLCKKKKKLKFSQGQC